MLLAIHRIDQAARDKVLLLLLVLLILLLQHAVCHSQYLSGRRRQGQTFCLIFLCGVANNITLENQPFSHQSRSVSDTQE